MSGQKMKKVVIFSYLEKSCCISHKLLCSNKLTFRWLISSFPQILWDTAVFRISRESSGFYSISKNTSPKLQQLRSKLASPLPCKGLISLLYLYYSQHSLKKKRSYLMSQIHTVVVLINTFSLERNCKICAQSSYYIVWDMGSTKAQPTSTYAYFTVFFLKGSTPETLIPSIRRGKVK